MVTDVYEQIKFGTEGHQLDDQRIIIDSSTSKSFQDPPSAKNMTKIGGI